ASKECIKVTNSNKLTEDNIDKILSIYAERKEGAYISRLVPNNEIERQDYNLSVSTYIEQEDTTEKIDIKLLNKEINEIVARGQKLRDEVNKIIAEIEEV
ncbi:MAG: type I restriction-modification system subunit M, partial [Spirochaetia bacterium]|nr:type I restriction-modification system subunit M [Spirochaetia bacterium]